LVVFKRREILSFAQLNISLSRSIKERDSEKNSLTVLSAIDGNAPIYMSSRFKTELTGFHLN